MGRRTGLTASDYLHFGCLEPLTLNGVLLLEGPLIGQVMVVLLLRPLDLVWVVVDGGGM